MVLQSLFAVNSGRSVLYLQKPEQNRGSDRTRLLPRCWTKLTQGNPHKTKSKGLFISKEEVFLCDTRRNVTVCGIKRSCELSIYYSRSVALGWVWRQYFLIYSNFIYLLTSKGLFHCEVAWPSLNDLSLSLQNALSFFTSPPTTELLHEGGAMWVFHPILFKFHSTIFDFHRPK